MTRAGTFQKGTPSLHFWGRVLRYPLLLPSMVGVLVIVGLSMLPRLQSDFGLERLLSKTDPAAARYREVQRLFGRDDDTVVIVMTDRHLFSAGGAREIVSLTRRLERLPAAAEVLSLANAPLVEPDHLLNLFFGRQRLAGGLGLAEVRPAVHPAMDSEQLKLLPGRILSEGLYRRRLLSEDAQTTAFWVRLKTTFLDDRHRAEVLAQIERAVRPSRQTGRHLLLTGNPPTRQGYLELLESELSLLIPVALVALTVALGFLFTGWTAILFTLLVIGTSQLMLLACFALLGYPLNLLSPAVMVILTVVSTSDAVHLLSRIDEENRRTASRRLAILQSMAALGRALLLTSLTTASGFFALAFSSIPMLAEFGLAVGTGVLIAYLLTLALAPLLCRLPPTAFRLWSRRSLCRLVERVKRRPVAVLLAVPLTAGVAGWGISLIKVESRIVDDVPESHTIAENRRHIENRLGGTYPMTLLVHAIDGPAMSADFLHSLATFQKRLSEVRGGTLSAISSGADLFSLVWRGLGRSGRLPESDHHLQRLVTLVNPASLSRYFDESGRLARVDLLLFDRGMHQTEQFIQQTRSVFESVFGETARLEFQGFTFLAHRTHRKVVQESLRGLVLSFLAVTLLLLIVLPPRIALLALVPNILIPLWIAGAMGYAGVALRISSCIVFSIVLGIAVDDTIHLLVRFQEESRRSFAGRLERTITSTGSALIVTSLILVAGFMVLTMAQFVPSRVLGWLVSSSVVLALAADLVILPAILILVKGWLHGSGRAQ